MRKRREKSVVSAVNEVVTDEIRQIIKDHGRLPGDLATLDADADLYQAGMTSHASVNVMLALEDHFDIEFPDRMLTRSVFESIASIEAADRRAAYEGCSYERRSVDRDQALLEAVRRSPRRTPRRTPTPWTARPASRSRRSPRCAKRRAFGVHPGELGGAGVAFETIAAACLELGRHCGASAMVFAMHQIQIATIARHLDEAPWFEEYLWSRVATNSGWSPRSPPRSEPAGTWAIRRGRRRPGEGMAAASRSRRPR